MNKPWLPTLSALAISVSILASFNTVRAEELKPGIMSISATGSASVKPDMAIVSLTVLRQGKTARDALSANNQAMAEVLAAMKNRGVADLDLQTSNFNIQPQFSYPKRSSSSGNQKPPVIVGYQVSNSLTVRVRELPRLGEILDLSVTLGVNSGGQIRFTSRDPAPAIKLARQNAMATALEKARTLAAAAGVSLARIIAISESQSRPRPQQFARAETMAMRAADNVPVASGENQYRVTVQVRWELGQ